jgi:hypothetical protein
MLFLDFIMFVGALAFFGIAAKEIFLKVVDHFFN